MKADGDDGVRVRVKSRCFTFDATRRVDGVLMGCGGLGVKFGNGIGVGISREELHCGLGKVAWEFFEIIGMLMGDKEERKQRRVKSRDCRVFV